MGVSFDWMVVVLQKSTIIESIIVNQILILTIYLVAVV